MSKVFPVILCGGSGVRLWPLSRATYPKQFADLGGKTLFGNTIMRVNALGSLASQSIVICSEEQRFLAAAILQEKKTRAKIILEPMGRNTAPAIALAALAAMEIDPNATLLVLPSDHELGPQDSFNKAVEIAINCAEEGNLVTFGITPKTAATGYGYIKKGPPLPNGFAVEKFVEKPNLQNATQMLNSGDYLWNSGMFVFKADAFLSELKKNEPAIYETCSLAWQAKTTDFDFTRVPEEVFAKSPAISIDYAVMERTTSAAVIPFEYLWSDLGSWEAFYVQGDKNAESNVVVGDVTANDVTNSYLHSTGRLLAVLGLNNLVVVETPDAVLVADRSRSEDVKSIVDGLRQANRVEGLEHLKTLRPWGSYEILAEDIGFKVKKIIVNKGAKLSLQLHHHRAEHWVVVGGTAKVTVGDKTFLLHEDQSTYIPVGTLHRLENPGLMPLVIVEIQSGAYLGEDDIIRVEDTYGRGQEKAANPKENNATAKKITAPSKKPSAPKQKNNPA